MIGEEEDEEEEEEEEDEKEEEEAVEDGGEIVKKDGGPGMNGCLRSSHRNSQRSEKTKYDEEESTRR